MSGNVAAQKEKGKLGYLESDRRLDTTQLSAVNYPHHGLMEGDMAVTPSFSWVKK